MPINRHAAHIIEQAVAQVASARATRAALILDARTAFVLTTLCDRLVRAIRIEAPDKLPTREPRPQLYRVVTPQRRALLARGIPTQTLPTEARQRMYAYDAENYVRSVLSVETCTVIFKVSAFKKVVWFKLDDVYYRECVHGDKPVHLTVFAMPPAAEAPAGAEALDFAAA